MRSWGALRSAGVPGSSGAPVEQPEPLDCRLDRAVRGLPEAANGCILHCQSDLVEQRQLAAHVTACASRTDAMERLLLADRPHPTGHALTAGLVAEEGRDPKQNRHQVDR